VHLGNPEVQYSQLGVLPYFEVLRRELVEQQLNVPVAVLTGSLVIIPTAVKPRLEAIFGPDKITFQQVGQLDEKDSIGKRYRRQDAIGTPYCVTIDHQTMEDNTVTLRHRDTMQQERVAISELSRVLYEATSLKSLLRKI